MPGITLKISGERNPELVRQLVPQLTALTCEVLEKRPEQTLLILDFVPHDQWFIHNRSLAEHGRNAFRLEVTVTDETNTFDLGRPGAYRPTREGRALDHRFENPL